MVLDLFGGYDHPPGCPGHDQVVPQPRGDRISQPISLLGVKHSHLRSKGLGYDHLFTRMEGIALHLQVRTVFQEITSQEPANAYEGETHGSSLDH